MLTNPALTAAQLDTIQVDFSLIPEMRNNTTNEFYQTNVPSVDGIIGFKNYFELLGKSPRVIGVWQPNGLQLGYEYEIQADESVLVVRSKDENGIDLPLDFPFDFSLYRDSLQDVIEDEIPRRPTDAEAHNIQVNVFSGLPKRDLTSY